MEETNKNEILEAIHTFSNNMDTQLNGLHQEMNAKFKIMGNEMKSGFSDIKTEINTLKADLEAQIAQLDKRTREDTEASMKDYSDLKARVEKLEKQFGQMQPA